MRVTKIGYGVANTINCGNYESFRPSGYAEVEIDVDSSYMDALLMARTAAIKAYTQSANDCIVIQAYSGKYAEKYPNKAMADLLDGVSEFISKVEAEE